MNYLELFKNGTDIQVTRALWSVALSVLPDEDITEEVCMKVLKICIAILCYKISDNDLKNDEIFSLYVAAARRQLREEYNRFTKDDKN